MKKFFIKLEEIWITAAFAEEGICEVDLRTDQNSMIRESMCLQKSL